MNDEQKNAGAQTALTVAENMTALQVCQNSASIERLGDTFAQSGFFGAVGKSAAIAALINCFIEGLSPMEYRAKYHTMENGTTTIKSDYIQREFHRLGGKWTFNEWTADVCDITFSYQGLELRGRVTLAEFKANGVAIGKGGQLKENWRKFPREMLKARCMATYIRALCPEALGGMYTPEEASDFTPAPQPQPQPAPAAPQKPASAPRSAPRAKDAVIDVQIADAPKAPQMPDYAVCPLGRSKGKRFEDLPTETLEKILAVDVERHPELMLGHKAAIADIIAAREEAENGDE